MIKKQIKFQDDQENSNSWKRKPNKNTLIKLVILAGLISVAAYGCSQLPAQVQELLFPETPTSQTDLPVFETLPPTPENVADQSTSTPAGPQILTIWVPPQFDPASDTPAGKLLQERIKTFSVENPGAEVRVRVKAATGNSGLLNSLSAASTALEPSALPALVALTRTEMEAAALKGLIFPMDELTSVIDDPDWYNYAKELALIQGSTFGAPFAGDGFFLIYRPAKIGANPTDWQDILSRGQPLAFPANDTNGLVTLALYLSAGGTIVDSQNRLVLEPQTLTEVLTLFSEGAKQGSFPSWLSQYQTDAQVWQAYQDQSANWAITWSSRYLVDLPVDSTAVSLPPLGTDTVTIANGWMWTLTDPVPERRDLSASLAKYLTDSDFLSEWVPEMGYLPTRPSVLAAWQDQTLRSLIGQTVVSARIQPNEELLEVIGPILRDATLDVIERQIDPAQAAQAAQQRLNPTEQEQ